MSNQCFATVALWSAWADVELVSSRFGSFCLGSSRFSMLNCSLSGKLFNNCIIGFVAVDVDLLYSHPPASKLVCTISGSGVREAPPNHNMCAHISDFNHVAFSTFYGTLGERGAALDSKFLLLSVLDEV